MSPTPRKNERTLQQRSLGRQLLLSHLSVAAVGLAILCIALISTFELRARVNLLVNEGVPLMQASSQMLTGVQHSLANLRGWVSLNDQKFLDDWQVAWREDIQPALALLNQECRRVLEQACDLQRLQNLKALLADLRESQWWVQDIAHTPGNDPARVAYLLDVEPSADKLNSVIAALLQEEIAQDGGSERKILLARLAELQNAFATTQLLLREILGSNGLNYEEQFRQQLERTTATVAQLTTSPLPTPEQSQFLNLLRMELRAFTQFAQEVIRIRRSPNWNIAIHTDRKSVV